MSKQTAMSNLLEDLKLTKVSTKESIDLINDKFISKTINEYVQTTLDSVINRIENELLEMEKEQMIDALKINRVEVIQHSEPYNGRAYVNNKAKDVYIQFQDNNETLKIFLK